MNLSKTLDVSWKHRCEIWGGFGGGGVWVVILLLTAGGESFAGSPDPVGYNSGTKEAAGTTQTALDIQTQLVDQQISEFETRFNAVKKDLPPVSSPSEGKVMEVSVQQDVPSEGHPMNEEEIQVLEETVVTDTFIDPFEDSEDEETVGDPWESINTRMFSFNLQADRYVLKPLARGYAWIVPDPVERALGRAINNIRFVPRTMNNLFQQKWKGASIETGRFLINTTVGVAGFFDVAESAFELEPANLEDFGQTLAIYGVGSGPYLVLPFLPPTTVRGGAGMIGDALMDPLSYFIPFVPQVSVKTTEIVNERSQNLELFEGVEAGTVDLYGAVRSGYMQRRLQMIKE